MKNNKYVLFITALFFILVSCSGKEAAYEEAINEGLSHLENDEYELAEQSFQNALEIKPEDEYANNLLSQTELIQEAYQHFDEENIEEAVETIKKIIEIEDGSEHLVMRANEIQEEIDNLLAKVEQIEESLADAENLLEDENVDDATEILENILGEDLKHRIFTEVKESAESLLKEAQSIQERIEKEREEELKREAEEKARKEAEEKARKEAEEKAKQAAAQQKKEIPNISGYWLNDELACHVTTTYITCAMPYSDFITYDNIIDLNPISSTEVEVTLEGGHKSTLKLSNNNNTLDTFRRVTKEEANAIFDGYYELE